VITLHRDGDVAEIVLARVDAHNAIDPGFVTALADAVGRCAVDVDAAGAGAGLRAVLIRADGPAFTVGGDLRHFSARLEHLDTELEQMISGYHQALLTIAELPVPVVCAAHGAVAGGGLGLLWAADVVLLADDAKLTTAFSRLGLSGDGGSSWYLPRMLGTRRALQLMLDATVLDAKEALELGLADQVVPKAVLTTIARERAAQLSQGPTVAYGEMRRLVRGAFERTLAQGLDAELSASRRCGASADARAGVEAFAKNQRPNFEGR
jgi:2-(1,2-epoxy-1,2-dihydrophenyl)acetyl-CoA isomerase